MYGVIADYGIQTLTWLLLALGAVLMRWIFPLVRHAWASRVLERAWIEVKAAVLEVAQIYVDNLKAGRADGKLTEDEKALAKAEAIRKLKQNLGPQGLARLAAILGVDVDTWLANKVEAAVKLGKPADPPPQPPRP